MFVITADQIDSRSNPSRGRDAVELIERLGADHLALPPDRTSGDEVQALTGDARTALEILLALIRDGHWRVGLGIGAVDTPLPDATRTATGDAFIAARAAIEAAKKRPLGAVIEIAAPQGDDAGGVPSPAALQAMLDLLLTVRTRRSPEGWEVTDLVDAGLSQGEAAERLGITPQAASKRAIAAATRVDAAARAGLAELLAAADPSVRADSSHTPARRPAEGEE